MNETLFPRRLVTCFYNANGPRSLGVDTPFSRRESPPEGSTTYLWSRGMNAVDRCPRKEYAAASSLAGGNIYGHGNAYTAHLACMAPQ